MNDVQRMPQKIIWIFILFVFGLVFSGGYFMYKGSQKNTGISNYEQCVAAGYPILKSFPPKCEVNGQVFTEEADAVIKPAF